MDGKRQIISKTGFKTQKEAIEAGSKALAEYNSAGRHFAPSELSTKDYIEYWLDNYCSTNLKQTTIEGYKKKLRLYIYPSLGRYKIKALTPDIIQQFINNQFNTGMSRNTLTSIKGILNASFRYAVVTAKFLQFNPCDGVRLPLAGAKAKIPTTKKVRTACTPEQIKKIFERFPEGHPAHIPLQLGYRAGLRLGECFGLMWEDIDFDNHTLSVNRQIQMDESIKHWTFAPPKYRSYRTIVIDDVLTELLKREHDKQQRAETYYAENYKQILVDNAENEDEHLCNYGILNYETGTPIHMVMQREYGEYIQPRILQHAGRIIHGTYKEGYEVISENWDYHSMRHTHATVLISNGVNPVEVQHRLGHKNIETTLNTYTHHTKQMEDEARDIMNNVL
jgi:integrase